MKWRSVASGARSHDSRDLYSHWWWIWLVIGGIVLTGYFEYMESSRLTTATRFDQLFVFHLAGYANLLLASSTLLYVSHLWFTSEAVGRWASWLATIGVLASALALATRWLETYVFHRPAHVPLSSLYEVMAVFGTLTVAIYLVMERVYRTRTAGAFVMPIVLGSVLFQIWLVAQEAAMPDGWVRILASYGMQAKVLGGIVGYGAIAIAAALGAAYLVGSRAEERGAVPRIAMFSLPPSQHIDALMHKTIVIGFSVLTLTVLAGALWSYRAWEGYWTWRADEMVWLFCSSYFFLRHVCGWRGRRLAWWAIACFGFAILRLPGMDLL